MQNPQQIPYFLRIPDRICRLCYTPQPSAGLSEADTEGTAEAGQTHTGGNASDCTAYSGDALRGDHLSGREEVLFYLSPDPIGDHAPLFPGL